MKVIFFLESLQSGGKERRLLELISFLKDNTDFKMHIVLTQPDIHYQFVYELGVPITIMKRWYFKKDPSVFFRFFNACLKFKPDIIHSWAGMTTFYAIPASLLLNIPIISNEITDATPKKQRNTYANFIWNLSRPFIRQIIANSHAGLMVYNVSSNLGKVIHNGIRMSRFQNLPEKSIIRQQYGINTKYVFAMVASFEKNKDYNSYIELARKMSILRNDITFLAIGGGSTLEALKEDVKTNGPSSVIFTGKVTDVEAHVNTCDLGYLLTYSEGIPNTLMEFMALKKPVIATNGGGTKELVAHNESGFLIENNDLDVIIEKTNYLLNNEDIRLQMGENGYQIILKEFSLEKMGESFLKAYTEFQSK